MQRLLLLNAGLNDSGEEADDNDDYDDDNDIGGARVFGDKNWTTALSVRQSVSQSVNQGKGEWVE